MKTIDLTKSLKSYTSGWVALDEKNNVVAQAKSFRDISEKVKDKKSEVILMPASDNYFGFIT